jgi:hypothetical protein
MTNQPLPADYFTPDGVFLLKPKHRDVVLGLTRYRSETKDNLFTLIGFILVFAFFPTILVITELTRSGFSSELVTNIGIGLMFFGFPVLGLTLLIRRENYLEQNGQLIRGILLKIEGQKDSDGDYWIKARYQFQSPRGVTLEGRYYGGSSDLNHLANHPLPPAGTPVAVWYANDNTHTML